MHRCSNKQTKSLCILCVFACVGCWCNQIFIYLVRAVVKMHPFTGTIERNVTTISITYFPSMHIVRMICDFVTFETNEKHNFENPFEHDKSSACMWQVLFARTDFLWFFCAVHHTVCILFVPSSFKKLLQPNRTEQGH